MSGIQIPASAIGDHELLAWAKEHGIDPDRVSMNDGQLPEIWNGTLSYGECVQDENGADLWDGVRNNIRVMPRTVRIVRPLPAKFARVIEMTEQGFLQ